jgi:adenosine deaminase
MGLSLADIKTVIIAGFKSAFLPFHIKQGYLRRVVEELDRFSADGHVKPMPAAPSSSGGREAPVTAPPRSDPTSPRDARPAGETSGGKPPAKVEVKTN